MKYDSPECNKFVADMKRAKQTPEHYHGRNYWEGPSVSCDADELQDVLRMTRVKCQWDNLGKGYIVYPRASGRLLEG